MLVTTSVISLLPLSLTLIVPEGVKVRPVGKVHVPMVGLALDALAARDVALLYNDLSHQDPPLSYGALPWPRRPRPRQHRVNATNPAYTRGRARSPRLANHQPMYTKRA